jgi:AcrR family transcriptional regulator
MAKKKPGRPPRDAAATKTAIVNAAMICLAKSGAEGLTFSKVARLARVNRATPYQYFGTREQLIRATVEQVSEKLLQSVFGGQHVKTPQSSADIMEPHARLLNFGMENVELCRVWLFEVMSSTDPAGDPFWKAFERYCGLFAKTEMAQKKIDAEVLAMIMLTSAFLWPVWIRAHAKSPHERHKLAQRFATESLRLAMYGSMRPEYFPEIGKFVTKR